jgi:capsular polysaccharide biosynthesis protein
MNDVLRLLVIVRRHWWYLFVPALLLAATGVWSLRTQTPQYRVSVTFLLTSNAPMNDTGDTLAYDFPSISRGEAFRKKVSDYLNERVTASDVATVLDVRNQAREVTIIARGPNPTVLTPVRDAAFAVLTQDGTLLWGKSGDTAVNIAELRREDIPVHESQWINLVMQMVLRGGAGVLIGLLVILYRR